MNPNVAKFKASKYKYLQNYQCQPSTLELSSFLLLKENPDRIRRKDFRCFTPLLSFFLFLLFFSCIYLRSLFFFSHHLYFSFLPVCLWFRAVGGVFFRCGMTSMTEMACATSPSSAFAAAAFGASSSSVRLRYQTVGPLYVGQAGWATLPHSYYALDYCTPK